MIKTFLFVSGLIVIVIPLVFIMLAVMPVLPLLGLIFVALLLGLAWVGGGAGVFILVAKGRSIWLAADTLQPEPELGNYPARVTRKGIIHLESFNKPQFARVTNWSPRTHSEAHQVEPTPPPALPPASIPTFSMLLDQGEIGQNPNTLLLGYSEGQPIKGTWLDLYSTAIGGISGSGKTTTTRFLAAQSALMGAKFILIDPHAEIADESLAATLAPLSDRFLFQTAIENGEILAALWAARQELERRLKQGKDTPLIVAVDEFSSLMRRDEVAKELAKLLADIAQQGRKVGVFGMCIGQIWTASATGGTSDLRDSFASAFVHRMKRNQARLLVPTDEAQIVERLPAGQALLSKTNGDLLTIAIPQTTAQDVSRVATMLATAQATNAPYQATAWPQPEATGKPDGSLTEAKINQASTAPQSQISLTADEAKIVQLFREGKDIAAIVKEVFNLTSSAGRNYQNKSADVQAVIRKGLGV